MTSPDIHRTTLRNGIRIVHIPTRLPILYTGLMVGTGTRDEQPMLNGMAHYIEHCVFKGTRHLSAKQIIDQTELIGGEINAYTTKEETVFYAATLPSQLERTLKLLSELVLNPTFPKDETDKELQVIFDEIETYNDSPSELIYDDFEALLFASHPLSLPILGQKTSLRRINQRRALEFIDLNYTTDNMVLFTMGNIRFSTLERLAERYLLDNGCSNSRPARLSPQAPTARQSVMRKRTHQAHVMIGGESPRLGSEEHFQMQMLANILGGTSSNALLNLALRERHGLVYTIEMTHNPLSDCGYWSLYYATETHNIEQCEQLINLTLSSFLQKPIHQRALEHYKHQMISQLAISSLNYENLSLAAAKQELYNLPLTGYRQAIKLISQITPNELYELANRIFSAPRTRLVYM